MLSILFVHAIDLYACMLLVFVQACYRFMLSILFVHAIDLYACMLLVFVVCLILQLFVFGAG